VVNNDLAKQGTATIMIELLKDKNNRVRRRAIAALGEYIFYGATQLDGTSQTDMWDIPFSCISLLMKQIKNSDDEIVRFYGLKTIENITSQSELGGSKFCFGEFVTLLLGVFNSGDISGPMKCSCAVILTNIGALHKEYLPEIIKKFSLKVMIAGIKEGDKRLQQAFLTLLNLYIFYWGESAARDIQEYFKVLFQHLMNILEHGSPPILKSKSLLMIILLGMNDFSVLHYAVDGKFMLIIDKLFSERNKNVQQVLEKMVDLFKKHIDQFLLCINEELPIILKNTIGFEEENFEQEDEGGASDKNTEIVIGSFNFICNAFASMGMQNKILTQTLLVDIFEFFEYLTGITGSKFVNFQFFSAQKKRLTSIR
jgi:serine/threonine-protein kinase ULK4